MAKSVDNLRRVNTGLSKQRGEIPIRAKPRPVAEQLGLHGTQEQRDEDLAHMSTHRDTKNLTNDGIPNPEDTTESSKLEDTHHFISFKRSAHLGIVRGSARIALDPAGVEDSGTPDT